MHNTRISFLSSRRRNLITLSLFSGTLVSPFTLAADEAPIVVTGKNSDTVATSYSQPDASIGSLKPVSRLAEAQSISVVTQQQLADYSTETLADAMRFVSGVSQGNTLAGTEDGIVRRGFGSNSDGSIYRDGIRSSAGMNLDATTDHVEVLKGSASLLYGIQNPGGVINVVSKKPEYQWKTKIFGQAKSAGGGSGGIDVTGPLGGGFAFRLIAEKQHEQYWRNYGHNTHNLLAPSLQWYGEKASFSLNYEHYQYEIPYDRGTAFIKGKPINVGYKTRLDDYSNYAWGINQSLSSHWDYQLNDTWNTGITAGWNQRKYSNNEVRVTAVNTTTGVVTRRADANRGFNHQTHYLAWNLSGTPEIAHMQHTITLGADYEMNQTYRAHAYTGKTNTAFTIDDPQYGLSTITNASTEKASGKHLLNRIYSRSVYAKDSISLAPKWTMVVGGRMQRFTQNQSSGVPKVTNYTDSGDKFLPQMGLIYNLTPEVSLYGSWSKSFTPSTTVDDNGNVGSPEQGTTYEVGSKWQISPVLLASVALYTIDERNVALSLNGDTYEVDRARSRGVEVELNGEIAKNWQLSTQYSYNQATITRDSINPANKGNALQNAPKHSASTYLSHKLTLPALPGEWTLGGGVQYVGSRAGDPDNSFTLPHYLVADSFLRWNHRVLGQKTQLQLNLNNLFNKHYYTSSGGNLRVAEGQTRNVTLSASVEF
ncbi:TonB-dependent siderophore receptor [Rosenbergiella epipactidis]|uniref:TonB-dependent siderophore receptor n=1 Tax=Rosenbergiella epipactidis TaxID=1544694 RepID=UPI001F4E2B1C|nr:TonB-dependent siderophore receptor [Rosenbergiella epipactidis]